MNAYAELPVSLRPRLVERGLLPWLGSRGRTLRSSAERFRVLGSEMLWASLEPRLEPTRYHTTRDKAEAMQVFCRRLCRTHGLIAHVLGSFPSEPTILACNHLSYLDPIVLLALRPCVPIAKVEVAGWPMLGQILSELGIVFVHRGNPVSGAVALRRAERALDEGVSVLNFPEGTTTYGDDVLPFHRGIFGLAQRVGTSVTPVSLRFEPREAAWVGDQGFLPHYMRQSARKRTFVRVAIGEPVEPSRFATPKSMAGHVRARVRDLNARDLHGRGA